MLHSSQPSSNFCQLHSWAHKGAGRKSFAQGHSAEWEQKIFFCFQHKANQLRTNLACPNKRYYKHFVPGFLCRPTWLFTAFDAMQVLRRQQESFQSFPKIVCLYVYSNWQYWIEWHLLQDKSRVICRCLESASAQFMTAGIGVAYGVHRSCILHDSKLQDPNVIFRDWSISQGIWPCPQYYIFPTWF